MFRHPKYYKELRKRALDERNRDLHVRPISGSVDSATDQAISSRKTVDVGDSVRPGPGPKQQAASHKHQASSSLSNKPQASSPKQQASSFKPQASSSKI